MIREGLPSVLQNSENLEYREGGKYVSTVSCPLCDTWEQGDSRYFNHLFFEHQIEDIGLEPLARHEEADE